MNTKNILFAGLLTGLMATSTAVADAVDDYVQTTLQQHHIPGASVLVVQHGTVLKERGYGFANVELAVPASADTVYQSASTGKQFTAAGVLILVDEGKLSLDDPLSKFFPEGPESWRRITIRHLLTHTSGIRDYDESDVDQHREYDEAGLLKVMMRLPLEFEPGTQWSYSNSGYLILGLITSQLSGMHWSAFQEQRLFRPIGMTTTRVISESAIVKNRSAGYELDDKGELKNQEWVDPSLNRCADGGLYYTVKDLAAWDAALKKTEFLSPASREAWVKPVALTHGVEYPYGFGWDINEQRGHRLLEHGGAWQGFRTAIARYVDQGLTVVVLTNLASAEPEHMAHKIAGLIDDTLRLPESPPRKDPVAGRTQKLHRLLEQWAQHKVDAQMARGLAETWTGSARETEERRLIGTQLKAESAFDYLGQDRIVGSALSRRGEQVATIAYYSLKTQAGDYLYRFYLTKNGRSADFSFEWP